MKIALIAKPGHADSGVGRYCNELVREMHKLGVEVAVVHPSLPLPKWFVVFMHRQLRWDLVEFFDNYPIWVRYPSADLYHITSQNLATLMFFHRPPGKTVITVHDIIPWIVRDNPQLRVYRTRIHKLFDQIAMKGLSRADALVADSNYSAASLDDSIDYSRVQVKTILLGMS